MNAIVVGVLFLIVSPAICDEGKNSNEKEIVTKNPQPYYNRLDNENSIDDDVWYERQLRAPSSGFYGMRGKKFYGDEQQQVEVNYLIF